MLFVVDLTTHDKDTLITLSQVRDGLIEARGTDGKEDEIRSYGLEDQPKSWLTGHGCWTQPAATRASDRLGV